MQPSNFEQYENVFKALSNGQRIKILYLLLCVDDKVTVSEFAYVFEDSTSNASRQLKMLRDARLLEKHREGKWTYYSAASADDAFIQKIFGAISAIPRSFVDAEIARCEYLAANRVAE